MSSSQPQPSSPVTPEPTKPARPPLLAPGFSRLWLPIALISNVIDRCAVKSVYSANPPRSGISLVAWFYFIPAPMVALVAGLVMVPIAGTIMTPPLIKFMRSTRWSWPGISAVLLLRTLVITQPLIAFLVGRRGGVNVRWVPSFVLGVLGVVLVVAAVVLVDPRLGKQVPATQFPLVAQASIGLALLHVAAGLFYRTMPRAPRGSSC
jgi:hypothetical protein